MARRDSGIKSVVCWPDLHFPHIDEKSAEAVYQFTAANKPDYDLHIGDNLDLSGISRFSTNNYIEQHSELVKDGLSALGEHFNRLFKINPKGKKVWILGNHDERLDAFVEKNPSWQGICDDIIGLLRLYGNCPKADLIDLVRIRDRGDDYKIGRMHFAHGFTVGVNTAKTHVEAYDESITVGHAHTIQMWTKKTRTKMKAGYVIGDLAGPGARKYMRGRPDWSAPGFAYMEYIERSGIFTQHLLPITDGKFIFGGKIYDGNTKKTTASSSAT